MTTGRINQVASFRMFRARSGGFPPFLEWLSSQPAIALSSDASGLCAPPDLRRVPTHSPTSFLAVHRPCHIVSSMRGARASPHCSRTWQGSRIRGGRRSCAVHRVREVPRERGPTHLPRTGALVAAMTLLCQRRAKASVNVHVIYGASSTQAVRPIFERARSGSRDRQVPSLSFSPPSRSQSPTLREGQQGQGIPPSARGRTGGHGSKRSNPPNEREGEHETPSRSVHG